MANLAQSLSSLYILIILRNKNKEKYRGFSGFLLVDFQYLTKFDTFWKIGFGSFLREINVLTFIGFKQILLRTRSNKFNNYFYF